MARYKVNVTRRGKTTESEPFTSYDAALAEANREARTARVVTITKDQEGADHPANAGKFFLERIIK
jgi:hypothetical protein